MKKLITIALLLCATLASAQLTTNFTIISTGPVTNDFVYSEGQNQESGLTHLEIEGTDSAGTSVIYYSMDFENGLLYVYSETGLSVYELPDMAVTEPTTSYLTSFTTLAPPVNANVSSSAMIAERTARAPADRTLYLSGEDIDSLVMWSPSNTNLTSVTVTDYTNTLTATSPADGFKMVWPISGTTTGTPVTVDGLESFFLLPGRVKTDEQFSIYGHNLMRDGETNCYAYIDGYGWITNTWGHEFKATFDVPDALTNGIYTVAVNNGYGRYGWGEEYELMVWSGYDYTTSTQTVTSGVFADLADAFDDAVANSTILVEGEYEFDYAFYDSRFGSAAKSNVLVKATGTGATFSCTTTNLSGKYMLGHGWEGYATQWAYDGITFRASEDFDGFIKSENAGVESIRNCTFDCTSLTNDALGRTILAGGYSYYEPFFLSDNVFTGQNAIVSLGSYSLVRGNVSYGQDTSCAAYYGLSGSNIDLSDCEGYERTGYDTSGRFILGQNASLYKAYIGENVAVDLECAVGGAGEHILIETAGATDYEAATAGGSDWVAMDCFTNLWNTTKNCTSVGDSVSIMSGTGVGQTRIISALNGTTGTVDVAWNIVPDTTSMITVQKSADRILIVNNEFDAEISEEFTASCVVSLYGPATRCIISGNNATQMQDGFYLSTIVGDGAYWTGGNKLPTVQLYNIVENNTLSDMDSEDRDSDNFQSTGYLFSKYGNRASDVDMNVAFANIMRDNTVTNAELIYATGLNSGALDTYTMGPNTIEWTTGFTTNIANNTLSDLLLTNNIAWTELTLPPLTNYFVEFNGSNSWFNTGMQTGPGTKTEMSVALLDGYATDGSFFADLNQPYYSMKMDSAATVSAAWNNIGATVGGPIATNTWYTIGFDPYDTLKAYRDGSLRTISANVSVGNLDIGRANNDSRYLKCRVEWVKVWTNGVLARNFEIENATGSIWVDSVNNYTSTLNNCMLMMQISEGTNVQDAVEYVPPVDPNTIEWVSFDGVDDYLLIDSFAVGNTGVQDYSVDALINVDSFGSYSQVLSGPALDHVAARFGNTTGQMNTRLAAGSAPFSVAAVPTNTWVRCVWERVDTNVTYTCYTNDVAMFSEDVGAFIKDSATELTTVGGYTGRFFDGKISRLTLTTESGTVNLIPSPTEDYAMWDTIAETNYFGQAGSLGRGTD